MLDITRYWYQTSFHLITIILWPFSWLFRFCIFLRCSLYRLGIFKIQHFPVPVIVVGNITVGGTGKTPFVIWLAQKLREQGYHPGIVSRGVGGKAHVQPYRVQVNDAASEVGDEAILLAQHSGCPVVVGIQRVAAVEMLLKTAQCNVVISDDGLQHYRLGRNIEIAIIDGARRFGNGCLLPAGPLREPIQRLNTVDFVVVNGESAQQNEFNMALMPSVFIALANAQQIPLTAFVGKKVHAVAGIGNPERFFLTLKQLGMDIIPHRFPDHHCYQAHEFDFKETLPILMTEKDAVKCTAFADERYWFLRVAAKIENNLEQALLTKLQSGVRYDSEEDFAMPTCQLYAHQQCSSDGEHRKGSDDARQ